MFRDLSFEGDGGECGGCPFRQEFGIGSASLGGLLSHHLPIQLGRPSRDQAVTQDGGIFGEILANGLRQLRLENLNALLPVDLGLHFVDHPGLKHLIVNAVQGDEIHLRFTNLVDAINSLDELQNDVDAVENVEEKHRAANLLQIDRGRSDSSRCHDLVKLIDVVEVIHRLFSLDESVLSANVNHVEVEIFQIHDDKSQRERSIAKDEQFFLDDTDSVADEVDQILKFGEVIDGDDGEWGDLGPHADLPAVPSISRHYAFR